MELTCGTNPHEPKTKPVSPLDLVGVLKRTQNQATKSFRFAPLLKRTQLLQVPPDTQEPQERCGSALAWGKVGLRLRPRRCAPPFGCASHGPTSPALRTWECGGGTNVQQT